MTPSALTPPEHDAHPDPVLLAVIADDPAGEFDALGPDPADADDPCTEAALRRARQHVVSCAACNAAVSRFAGNALVLATQNAATDGEVAPDGSWFDDLIDRAGDAHADPSADDIAATIAAGATASPEPSGSGARVISIARRPYQRAGWFAAAGIALVAAIGIGGLVSRLGTGRDENAATAVDGALATIPAEGAEAVVAESAESPGAPIEATDAIDAEADDSDAGAETAAAEAITAETTAAEFAAAETAAAAVATEERDDSAAAKGATESSGEAAPPLAELEPAGIADASVTPERTRVASSNDLPSGDGAGASADGPPTASRAAPGAVAAPGVVAAPTGTPTTLAAPVPPISRLNGRDLGVLETVDSVDEAIAAMFARVVATEPGALGAAPPSLAGPPSAPAVHGVDNATGFSAAAAATARDRCAGLLAQQSPTVTRFVAVGQVGDRALVLGISGTTGAGTVVVLEARVTSCQLVERRPF